MAAKTKKSQHHKSVKKRKISPEKLRRFRTQISKLKKAGLVPATVDARTIQPTEHYRKIVREFSGVLEGRQRTVKLSRKFLDIAKEDGKTVRGNVVIIDNNPGMRVIHDKSDPYGYHISHPSKGYEIIEHRGPRGISLKKYSEYAESQLEPGGLIGFTVEGYRSNTLYNSVAEAVAAFDRYYTMRFGKMSEKIKLASSFTIYRVPKRLKWGWKVGKAKPRRAKRKRK